MHELPSNPLRAEELYILNTVVEKAKVEHNNGEIHLVVPVSPMFVDLLRGLRLAGRLNAATLDASELQKQSDQRDAEIEKARGPILIEAVEQFMEQAKGPLWGEGTREHYVRSTSLLIGVLGGSKRVKEITPSDLAKVKGISIALPTQHHAHYAHVPVIEAAQVAIASGAKTRALSTVGRELYGISVFFNWCVSQWIIDRNPSEKITFPPRIMRPNHAREAFLIEQLNQIFRAPLFTGCNNDERNYALSGTNLPRGSRFWLPLIALYSGLRLGEIAQLTAGNVIEIERILCFKIAPTLSPNGKVMLLKTNAARRNIPVHSELLKIGFKEFAAATSGHLFPDLNSLSIRKRTTYYSRWFSSRFLKTLDLINKHLSFHSFRHNFRDAMREGSVQPDFVNLLGGWAPRSAASRYGGGRAPILLREIEKVCYPGLDLSHLYLV